MTQLVTKVVSVLATTDDPAAPGPRSSTTPSSTCSARSATGWITRASAISSTRRRPTSLPLVTIGKCAGAIKTGQVVQHPIAAQDMATMVNRPAADLYLTLARAMGAANVTFPGQTAVLPGVLT